MFNPGSESYTSLSSKSNKVVSEVVTTAIKGFNQGVCTPGVSLKTISDRFTQASLPEAGATEEEIVKYFQALEKDAIDDELHLQSQSMMGHMTGVTLPWTGAVAQILSLLNLNVVKAETAKCGTFVERETVGMLHRLFWQKEDSFYESCIQDPKVCLGHVTSGGTVANIEALWCARNTALPGVEEVGLMSSLREHGHSDAVIICSRLAHYSVSKACGVLGLGTRQMISLPVNHNMSVNIEKMRESLEDCKLNNKKVLAIVALAGSTECGSFDDITAIAALAKEFGVWLHVDGAWGGGLIFSPQAQKTLFAGVHLADSVTIDAHKQLFTPMGFGMVLYGNEHIAQNITKTAQYIIRADSSDLGRFTMEGSRPAIAHYLRANLFILGREGYAAAMDRKMRVTNHLAKWLKTQPDFDLLFDPQADILLCRYIPQDAAFQALDFEDREVKVDELTQLVQTVQSSLGRTFVSRTAVFDPRSDRSTRTHFFRIVVNAQIAEEDSIRILKDTRFIADMLSLGAKPLAEAETLAQALAHVAMHNPATMAVKSGDETLTFQQLFDRACALRCKLSCPQGSVVPIMTDNGVAPHIAALAVMLHGCAGVIIDASKTPEEVAKCLQEINATDMLVTVSRLATLAEAKKRLAKGQASSLRALTVANAAPVSVSPCTKSTADAASVAQVLLTSQGTVKLTHRQLLDMFDESSILSALDCFTTPENSSAINEEELTKTSQNIVQDGEFKKALQFQPPTAVQN